MAAHEQPSNSSSSDSLQRTSTSSSRAPSLQSPRKARFAEATSVVSPIEPSAAGRNPFADPLPKRGNMDSQVPKTPAAVMPPSAVHHQPQPQVGDIGFGYIGGDTAGNRESGVEVPMTPKSPLKSALKSPGAPPRDIKGNPLSPTWKEEEILEKKEEKTDKRQKSDLKIKTRIRMAKMMLRGTNFACSLIVLAMLSSTFTIFNATKSLPTRNNFPAWSNTSKPWPQIVVLSVACVSLAMSLIIFCAYFRGGHRRAEKLAVYYTVFAVGFFIFSIVMWCVAAGVLQQSHAGSNSQDIWGWSCKDNPRKHLFEDSVNYDVVCRMQNWSLVCALIEIVVEIIAIIIYSVIFYRYYTKRKLRKSMADRDKARSDLYLAHLRSQSAPNTPGMMSPRFGADPYSPRDGGYNPLFSPGYAERHPEKQEVSATTDEYSSAEEGNATAVRYISAEQKQKDKKPFQLQAPPTRGTPRTRAVGFDGSISPDSASPTGPNPLQSNPSLYEQPHAISGPPMSPRERQAEHVAAAPGEQQYGAVAIPGAYASPLQSPGFNLQSPAQGNFRR